MCFLPGKVTLHPRSSDMVVSRNLSVPGVLVFVSFLDGFQPEY